MAESIFTISLDFELYWGVRDKRPLADCRSRLLGARRAVPRMLAAFDRRGVAATWAVVGLLLFDDKTDLMDHLPDVRPSYRRTELSPYPALAAIGRSEADDPYHFGRSLVRRILDTPRMELGTHTFSHYYCLEDGQEAGALAADLRAALSASAELGARPTSIVFPRNQYDRAALDVCRALSLDAYRGTEPSWLYRSRGDGDERLVRRAGRLLDAHVPVTRTSLFDRCSTAGHPADVRASRFLRPCSSGSSRLPDLRLRRVLRGMSVAAERGKGYHLWWHPHNFGADVDGNMRRLEVVLDHYARLRVTHGMRSLGMTDAARALAA